MSEVASGTFDAVVIGAGLVGAAVGYGLAARGLRTRVTGAGGGSSPLVWRGPLTAPAIRDSPDFGLVSRTG